jgi:hypothetical protein
VSTPHKTPAAQQSKHVQAARAAAMNLAGHPWFIVHMGGGLLHVDTFAHNKSGIAYQGKNRRAETAVDHKREPLRQPRLPPNCTR